MCAWAAVLMGTGCGGRTGVEITGTVTRAGGGPVTGGEVVFEPAAGAPPENLAARRPIAAGRYRFGPEAGVQPGAWVARVVPPSALPDAGDGAAAVFTPLSRPVTVSTTAAENVFDFTVEPLKTFLP